LRVPAGRSLGHRAARYRSGAQSSSMRSQSVEVSCIGALRAPNCNVDLRSTTAVIDRRLEFLHFGAGRTYLVTLKLKDQPMLNESAEGALESCRGAFLE